MKVRFSLLAISFALGLGIAQTPQDNPQSTPATPSKTTTPSGATAASTTPSTAKTPAGMKSSTFKGVLMDRSCASGASGGSCPATAKSTEFAMKLDDGRMVHFDLVGNQRAQDALKNDKEWGKDLSANKPIHAKVNGVLVGDQLIVSSLH